MNDPSQRAARRKKGLLVRLSRALVVLLATFAVLLHAAVGARHVLRDAGFASSPCPASHILRANAEPGDPAIAASFACEGEALGGDVDDQATTDESGPSDSPADSDDIDDLDDFDEMIVQQLADIPRAAFATLLRDEIRRLYGVIHSPEPRPARQV